MMRDDAHDDDDEIATPRFYRARHTGGVRAGTDRRHRRRAHGRERRVPSQRQERRSSRHDDARQINARSRCDDVAVVGRAGARDAGVAGIGVSYGYGDVDPNGNNLHAIVDNFNMIDLHLAST